MAPPLMAAPSLFMRNRWLQPWILAPSLLDFSSSSRSRPSAGRSLYFGDSSPQSGGSSFLRSVACFLPAICSSGGDPCISNQDRLDIFFHSDWDFDSLEAAPQLFLKSLGNDDVGGGNLHPSLSFLLKIGAKFGSGRSA